MSMVAMTEVRKGGSVPNTSRQFALIKENGRGVRSMSSFEEYRRGLEDKFNFAPNSRNSFPYQRESNRIR
jgi:hypothetical protein